MIKRILIVIRRYNGDVLLASPLIQHLHKHYHGVQIDLLVNDDTLGIARALQPVHHIHTFSYQWKNLVWWERLKAEIGLLKKLFRRYDLAISLTASDSSVLYALLSGRQSISCIDAESRKNWWKTRLLNGYFQSTDTQHILLNNLEPLRLLGILVSKVEPAVYYTSEAKSAVQAKLLARHIHQFVIFHPSTQHDYKIYPEGARHALLQCLSKLGIPIVVTGAKTELDLQIKKFLPTLDNVYDLIGETNLDEYIALSDLSLAYVGGDTMNMHVAAAQNKRVFAIFGPTLLHVWSPWDSVLQCAATASQPVQTYGNMTVFQANMPCVPCGRAGCDDHHGKSECLSHIDPSVICAEVSAWLATQA